MVILGWCDNALVWLSIHFSHGPVTCFGKKEREREGGEKEREGGRKEGEREGKEKKRKEERFIFRLIKSKTHLFSSFKKSSLNIKIL